jgi:transcriptional regulator with XRE-family HTH domain
MTVSIEHKKRMLAHLHDIYGMQPPLGATRLKYGLTQAQIAREANRGVRTVRHWERWDRDGTLSLKNRLKYAAAFELAVKRAQSEIAVLDLVRKA